MYRIKLTENEEILTRHGKSSGLIYVKPSPDYYRQRKVIVRCRCGSIFETMLNSIRTGNTASCGCYHRSVVAESLRKTSTGKVRNRKQLPIGYKINEFEIVGYYGTENRNFYYKVLNNKTGNILKLSRKQFMCRCVRKIIYLGRASVRNALRATGYKKTDTTLSYIGCSYQELLRHLGRLPNSSEEIDHICPVSQASNEEEVRKLCHYSNLRIISKMENKMKSNNKTKEAEEMCIKLLRREWK